MSRVSRWVRDEAAGEPCSLVDSSVHSLRLAAVCHPCVTFVPVSPFNFVRDEAAGEPCSLVDSFRALIAFVGGL